MRSYFSLKNMEVSKKIAKTVAEIIAGPIAEIINDCIRKSYFPSIWKKGKDKPLLNKSYRKTGC